MPVRRPSRRGEPPMSKTFGWSGNERWEHFAVVNPVCTLPVLRTFVVTQGLDGFASFQAFRAKFRRSRMRLSSV